MLSLPTLVVNAKATSIHIGGGQSGDCNGGFLHHVGNLLLRPGTLLVDVSEVPAVKYLPWEAPKESWGMT